jgi:hypothetical protein
MMNDNGMSFSTSPSGKALIFRDKVIKTFHKCKNDNSSQIYFVFYEKGRDFISLGLSNKKVLYNFNLLKKLCTPVYDLGVIANSFIE